MLVRFKDTSKRIQDMFRASVNNVFWSPENRVNTVKECMFTYDELLHVACDLERKLANAEANNKRLLAENIKLDNELNALIGHLVSENDRLDREQKELRDLLKHPNAFENIIKTLVKVG